MKIYIICPVRNQSQQQGLDIENYVRELEKIHEVFYPKRDAPQRSETGFEIVETELRAIEEADEIHVFWDVNSKGSHFDLGMCYALGKKIIIKHLFQPDGVEKSYVKVVNEKMNRGEN
jgi:hypothetical protein